MNTVTPHTDNMLIRQLSQGDRNAYELIYRKYWWTLFNAAWKRLKDKQKAEDLAQEVFFNLWKKRERLEIENVEAYLKKAVRYEILNYLSRTKKTYYFFGLFQEILLENDTPETHLLSKNLMRLIAAYADTLPEKRRQIFLLHIETRLSTREIADILGISQKTVQNQLRTAINEFKPHIAPLIACLITSHLA